MGANVKYHRGWGDFFVIASVSEAIQEAAKDSGSLRRYWLLAKTSHSPSPSWERPQGDGLGEGGFHRSLNKYEN